MSDDVRFIDGTIGPHEVGVMFAVFLFGLVTIQAFTYSRKYPDDPKYMKIFISFIWVLLFSHTIISTFSLYRRTVTNYGRSQDLDNYPEGICAAFGVSGVIGSAVQSFFAYRLRKLSGWSSIAFICWTLSLLRLGSLLFISVTSCQTTTVHEYMLQWTWLVIIALTVSACVDLLIAGSLSYCLWNRRRDVFKHAQRVVDKLIACSIQTGALTSFASILMLVLYATVKSFAWMAAYLVISGLYGNYLLASLNARQSLREDMDQKPTFLDILSAQEDDMSLQPITSDVNNSTMISAHVDHESTVVITGKHTDLEHGNGRHLA